MSVPSWPTDLLDQVLNIWNVTDGKWKEWNIASLLSTSSVVFHVYWLRATWWQLHGAVESSVK